MIVHKSNPYKHEEVRDDLNITILGAGQNLDLGERICCNLFHPKSPELYWRQRTLTYISWNTFT